MATEATVGVNAAHDALADEYLRKQAALGIAESELKAVRDLIEERVRKEGMYPPRATKTRVCYGEEFELRLTERTEVSVNVPAAMRLRAACYARGCGRLFRKLFRPVMKLELAGGAHEVLAGELPKKAPKNLRSLFALAVKVDDVTPSVEVRRREKKEEAA